VNESAFVNAAAQKSLGNTELANSFAWMPLVIADLDCGQERILGDGQQTMIDW
jgi:hypothetical protein